ncbi:hypothetical protein [Hellea balneolensis]|uniref:hypothetical protein n=1 Tax=Hellea balneolensis TaxID=287478 RepID=UPI0004187EEB|nr:hypothetical protein [Hellea balneolensis]
MTSPVKLDYKKYGTPAKLTADKSLSDAEKVKLLQCWHDDEEALIRASAEGLSGGEPSRLQEVLEVLKDLKCQDELNNNI